MSLSKEQIKIYFDFDDVIKPLVKRWVIAIQENLGEPVNYTDITSFDFLGKSKYLDLLKPELFDHEVGEPEDGAVEVLNRLKRIFPVHMISATQEENIPAKKRWLDNNLPGVFDRKTRHWTHEKYEYAEMNRILVDDATHNLKAWADHGGIAVVIDRPWNQDWRGYRAYDFNSLEILIYDIATVRGMKIS